MIDLKPSPRMTRFAKLWLLNFAKIMAIGLAAITIGGTIGYLIVLAGQTYGYKIVLGGIALTWLLMLAGVAAGAISDAQLTNMEHEEEKTMRKLKEWP